MGANLEALFNDSTGYGNESSSRNGVTVDTFLIHGGAQTNYERLKADMGGGVSANIVVKDGRVARCVPQGLRAHTSGARDDGGRGAAWDRRSITVETAQHTSSPWSFSKATEDTIVAIGIAMRKDGMLPVIDRRPGRAPVGVIGHRELKIWYGAGYATECPAGWSTADLDRIAARILAGDGPPPVEPDWLAELAPIEQRHLFNTVNAMRESTIHPQGYTYDAASLGVLEELRGTYARIKGA